MTIKFRTFLFPFLFIFVISLASLSQAGQIAPDLQAILQTSTPSEEISVIITLSDQADLSLISGETDKHVKRSRVVKELKDKADTTQGALKALLESGGSKGMISLWIINGIAATVPARMMTEIADFPGVGRIDLDTIVEAPPVTLAATGPPEWSISRIKAPDLWSIGIGGSGTVVANLDTGVDVAHSDLQPKWRGGACSTPPDCPSWFDPYRNSTMPYDQAGALSTGHGTGTMGIMVGDSSGGTAIGVAPEAQWIAAKIFTDAGFADLSRIHQAFQWLLAPAGNPANAPDVVNNSWGLDNVNGCSLTFQPDILVLKAAGISVVFSAGNSGPNSPTSISPPNNVGSFAVGATDINNTIAFFSSRGPSPPDVNCGGDGTSGGLFPHVVAPGVNVKTSDITSGGLFPNSYAIVSGTSFSAPYVAGVMALLTGAFPALTPAELESILEQTALDLGSNGPDNTYGNGLIDAAGAYQNAFNTVHNNTPVPQIASLPAAYDFGPLGIKKTSLQQVFAIVNQGTADLVINPSPNGAFLSGPDPSDFIIIADGCSGQTIGSLLSCTVTVSFSPDSTGAKEATLSIGSNDPAASVLDVFLGGTGFIPAATIGVYRPSNHRFYLKNSNTTGVADAVAQYGVSGDIPIVGDWDGNGTTTIGVYRPSNQTFYLRNSNSTGVEDVAAQFGNPGDIPIVGDWDGNGTTTIGVYRPSNQKFYLRNSNTTGVADMVARLGVPGDLPITGDWDGNGTTTIGVYRPSNQKFYLRNSNTTGVADVVARFGIAGDIPIIGDWTGKGYDSIGVYRPSNQTFYLRNANTTGAADLTIHYGVMNDIPVAGNWDGLP